MENNLIESGKIVVKSKKNKNNKDETWIDRIIKYDDDFPIYSSDVYPYENYIGYEDENGNIILYNDNK